MLTVRNTLQILKSVLNKEEIYRIIQISSEYIFFIRSFPPSRHNMKVNLAIQLYKYKINKNVHKYFFPGERGVRMLQERGMEQAGEKIQNIQFMIRIPSDSTKSQKLVSNQISGCYLHAGQNYIWHPYFNSGAF